MAVHNLFGEWFMRLPELLENHASLYYIIYLFIYSHIQLKFTF